MCHFFCRILLFCTQWYLLFGLSFVVVILFIVVFVVGIKCLIKSKINSYAIGWWKFCVSLASFFILNVIYTEKEENEINKYIQSVAGGSKYNPIN